MKQWSNIRLGNAVSLAVARSIEIAYKSDNKKEEGEPKVNEFAATCHE